MKLGYTCTYVPYTKYTHEGIVNVAHVVVKETIHIYVDKLYSIRIQANEADGPSMCLTYLIRSTAIF